MNLLADEIKNTRFIITIMMIGLISCGIFGTFGIGYYCAVNGIIIDQIFLSILNTLIGAVIAAFMLCNNWYFKERENKDLKE